MASGCGIDINERSLAQARRAVAQLGTLAAIRFESAPPESLPRGAFDVVTLIDVMHHVPPAEQRGFFAAAAARVRPKGLLVYKDICARPWWKAWGNRLHDLLLARQWIQYVPLCHVIGWAAEAGFTVLRKEEYTRFWYGHELLVLRRD